MAQCVYKLCNISQAAVMITEISDFLLIQLCCWESSCIPGIPCIQVYHEFQITKLIYDRFALKIKLNNTNKLCQVNHFENTNACYHGFHGPIGIGDYKEDIYFISDLADWVFYTESRIMSWTHLMLLVIILPCSHCVIHLIL
jgi:hypothetical protein